MKVSELIELLQEMPQDMEVYSMCDHGQSPQEPSTPVIAYTRSLDYALYDAWSTYPEEVEEHGYAETFVLL